MADEAFLPSEAGALRQGEVISGITIFDYDPVTREVQPNPKGFAILVNQDCDLIQDFGRRQSDGGANLEYALLAEGQLWEEVKPTLGGRDLWKPISQNKNERFQVLSKVAGERDGIGEGIPTLIVDFRALFSVPMNELYRQIEMRDAQRRCRLNDIYRENFQLRLATFLARIPLPVPHTAD